MRSEDASPCFPGGDPREFFATSRKPTAYEKANEHYLRAVTSIENAIKAGSVANATVYLRDDPGRMYARLARGSDEIEQGRLALEQFPVERDFISGVEGITQMASIHAILRDADAAMPLLKQLMKMPAGTSLSVVDLKLDPIWDPIRNDPRFQQLIARGDGP